MILEIFLLFFLGLKLNLVSGNGHHILSHFDLDLLPTDTKILYSSSLIEQKPSLRQTRAMSADKDDDISFCFLFRTPCWVVLPLEHFRRTLVLLFIAGCPFDLFFLLLTYQIRHNCENNLRMPHKYVA